MTPLLDNQRTIMDQLKAGEFVKGMEDYYAEDIITEESTGSQTKGKEVCIANEKKFLEGVQTFHYCKELSIGVGQDDGNGNGVTFAQYDLKVDLKDGTTFNPKQVQVTRWESGKAKRITFYYDPAKV